MISSCFPTEAVASDALLPAGSPVCVALVGIAVGADSADARTYRELQVEARWPQRFRQATDPPRRPRRRSPRSPPQAHLVVVSIPKQRISVYGAGGILTQSAVSTGMSGFPTPTGVFSVIQKNRYHHSNIYSGAPMPFMQRITWSGVALHAGVLPGYPASHGCIRLTHNFASELWAMTRMGVRVVVAPEDVQAVEFAHPALPMPTLTPAPAPVADAEPAKSSVMTVSANDRPSAAGDARRRQAARSARARQGRTRFKSLPRLRPRPRQPRRPSRLRRRERRKPTRPSPRCGTPKGAVAAAKAKLDAAIKAVEAAKTPEAIERAKSAQAAAEAKLEEATKVAAEAARRRGRQDAGGLRGRARRLGRREGERRGDGGHQGGRAQHRAHLRLRQQEDGPRLHPPGLDADPRGAGHLQGARTAARDARLRCHGAGRGQQGHALAVRLAGPDRCRAPRRARADGAEIGPRRPAGSAVRRVHARRPPACSSASSCRRRRRPSSPTGSGRVPRSSSPTRASATRRGNTPTSSC